MFTDRFNLLLDRLGLEGNSAPARLLGCDRSYVSRLRTGSRLPAPRSRAGRRVLRTLLDYAEEAALLPRLDELCGGHEEETLTAWLWEGWTAPERRPDPPRSRRRASPAACRKFGERLSALMELADLNNARLARLANVDASLLSRYRRGLRAPAQNSKIVEVLASVLLDRVSAREGPEALCLLLGAEEIGSREEGLRRLLGWLFDEGGEESGLIEAFLTDVQRFDPQLPQPHMPPEAAVESALLRETARAYTGQEGLRRAVLRFLGSALEREVPALWLYSDQDMSWLTEDAGYALRWRSLMLACVRRGIRIRIVHNVDRGLKELLEAIRSWLPLYMSGLVESYTASRPRGTRFSHTLFLAPEMAAVSCFFPAGQERAARYRYETEREDLAAEAALFRALLSSCRPLFRVTAAEQSEPGETVFRPRSVPGVELAVGERSVTVRHMEAPVLSFTVTHPVLREAFSAYIDRAEKEL